MPATTAPQPAPVMFQCPAKGPVFTGHKMRPAEFDGLQGPRAFRCAACGNVHTWTVETAWLQGRVRPAPAPAQSEAAAA